MPDTTHLLLFIPPMLAIVLLPGPDMLFVIAQSLRGGPRLGIISTAGTISGGFVQIGAATVGLSTLIAQSAIAFSVLKLAGAAYLIYLGIRVLRERPTTISDEPHRILRPGAAFVQGFATNVLNPKIAVFMLSFLPQFIDPRRGHVGLQIAVLGVIWYATGFVILSGIALAAARLRALRNKNRVVVGKRLVGGLFIGLGAFAALRR